MFSNNFINPEIQGAYSLTLFIGLIIVLKAQSPIGFNFGNDNKYKLEANYSNNLGSNLNNKFLYSIYQSKFLDDKLINNTLDNINENSNLTGNTSDFEVSFLEGLEAILSLPEVELEIPLSEIYRDVELIPEEKISPHPSGES